MKAQGSDWREYLSDHERAYVQNLDKDIDKLEQELAWKRSMRQIYMRRGHARRYQDSRRAI